MQNFKELLTEIEKDISLKAHSRKISEMTSDDVYQELYLHLWEKSPEFDESKSSFRTWANNLMSNKMVDLWRKTKKDFTKDKDGFSVRRAMTASDYQKIKEKSAKGDENNINFYENLGDGGEQVETIMDNIDFQIALDRAKVGKDDRSIMTLLKEGIKD